MSRNRGWWWTLALALAVASVACSGNESAETGTKKASTGAKIAAEAKYDFGKVRQGLPVEHVFKIRNEGDAELRIENAHGS